MKNLKVLNKNKINELLEQGNILMYNTIYAKSYIIDNDNNIIGAVRFNTYLNIVNNLKKINMKNDYLCKYYIV